MHNQDVLLVCLSVRMSHARTYARLSVQFAIRVYLNVVGLI